MGTSGAHGPDMVIIHRNFGFHGGAATTAKIYLYSIFFHGGFIQEIYYTDN